MDERREVVIHHTRNEKGKPIFVDNEIRTTKYNILTFLPKNLFEQFSRIANFYFLIIITLLQFDWAPISATVAVLPLSIVIGVSAIREAVEDILRWRSDQQINKSIAHCLRDGSFQDILWKQILVGDIILVKKNEQVPADIVLISSSSPDGFAYIETSNLDGETNLKTKQSLTQTLSITTPEQCCALNGSIHCDLPNNQLYSFYGVLSINDYNNELPLDNKQILLRGCKLKNIDFAIGVVVYSGKESKIMKNASTARSKRSRIEKELNIKLVSVFIFMIVLVLFCGSMGYLNEKNNINSGKQWYFYRNMENRRQPGNAFFIITVSTLVVINAMIPISLYVTLEVVRVFQCLFVVWDLSMYDSISQVSAIPRTTNISDDLGQIEYIFSDKTGTLTQNSMEFMKCSIAGEIYGNRPPEVIIPPDHTQNRNNSDSDSQLNSFSDVTSILDHNSNNNNNNNSRKNSISNNNYYYNGLNDNNIELNNNIVSNSKINNNQSGFKDEKFERMLNNPETMPYEVKHFLNLLAMCHSVIPAQDETKPFGIEFQASSPDETALVSAAANFNYIFTKRTPETITVQINGVEKTIDILAMLEFTSERKRSSVIIRDPDTSEIILYCKGADDIIMKQLKENDPYKLITQDHLHKFANEGLRTLCCAMKVIDQNEFNDWISRFHEASCLINGRSEAINQIANEIEHNLTLLGATAIEDKLQVGVGNTIDSLLKAGIHIWIITGDKKETAINIGYACSLLNNNLTIITLDSNDPMELSDIISKNLEILQNNSNLSYALIVSGSALSVILDSSSTINTDINISDTNKSLNTISADQEINRITLMSDNFFKLATLCHSVVCCRVSPLQKASIVRTMRKNTGKECLAIGDGANDVGMILESDVGVGISGKEGRQAVLASDYSIAQFRFLKPLLLVHGRLNFYRNVDLIYYSFYKNMVFTFNNILFAFYSGFCGNTVIDSYLYMVFNVIFTSAPPVVYAALERDVSIESMLKFPSLYLMDNKRNYYQSYFRYWLSQFLGIYHACVCFFVTKFGLNPFIRPNGQQIGLEEFGTALYFSVVIIVNLKIALMSKYWTWLHHLFIWLSIAIYPLVVVVIEKMRLSPDFIGVISYMGEYSFWISSLAATFLAILPLIVLYCYEQNRDTIVNRVRFLERNPQYNRKLSQVDTTIHMPLLSHS